MSSSGSAVGALGELSATGAFFFISRIFARCLPPLPDAKRADGMTKPSSSPSSSSSSSVSVSGRDVEVEEVEQRSKPKVE
jgi:hypothetical protein